MDIQAAGAGIRKVDIRLAVVADSLRAVVADSLRAVVADSLRAVGNQVVPRTVVDTAALGNQPFYHLNIFTQYSI